MTPWNEFKSFLSGKALSASPEVIEALAERRVSFIGRLGGSNQRITTLFDTAVNATYSWYYQNSPAVRTVVDLLASNVAQLDLRLYEEIATDEREENPDHPAAVALRYPNAKMSSDQFIRYLIKSWLLYDNAFALKVRENNGPLQFVMLPAERIKVRGRGLQPEFYVIQYMNGTESTPIPANQMLHWRGENFEDMRLGTSRLETLRSVIAEEAAMAQAIVELAKSGLAEPQWVFRPLEAPEWSNEARRRFEEDMSARLKNATSRPPVAEEGMELRGFGVSPKDAEMLAVRKYALQQVATLYNVPLGMVGLADNVEQAQSEFYSDTLPPLCENLCRQLNLQVVQEEFSDTELYFEFDLDEKMMGNERLKALTSAAGVPPLLRNEARAKLNLAAVDGGDEPVTPANMIPGSKPAPNVMPIQNPQGPEQDGSAREGDLGVTPQNSAVNGNGHGKALLIERQVQIERRRDEAAEEIEGIVRPFFARQYRSVKHKKTETKAVTDERYTNELASDLVPVFVKHGTREGKIRARRIMSEFDGKDIVNYMTTKATKMAEALNEQTAKDIAEYGMADAFARAADVRAPGVARAAATDISAFAAKEAVRQSGQTNRMVTIAGGECDICAPFQGSWPINDVPGWPGYHNNCTCVADLF